MKLKKKAWQVLLSLHRILGTLLSLFMLMWFVSGMVMLYHSYPRVGDKALPHTPPIPTSALSSLSHLPDSCQSISFATQKEKTVIAFSDKDGERYERDAFTFDTINGTTTIEEARELARAWGYEIKKEKVLSDRLDVFVPFGRNRNDLPIYRFTLDDPDATQLYFSSRTGALLQATTASERFWAYLGPIPHYLYIWQLREHTEAWIHTIEWIAGLGAVMCLSGIIIGIVMYIKVWKHKRRFRTPYRSPWHLKWHHIFGFFFGFFAFMFILSGALSFDNMPRFLRPKVHHPELTSHIYTTSAIANDSTLTEDLEAIFAHFPKQIKGLDVQKWGEKQYYNVALNDGWHSVMVHERDVLPLEISEDEVRAFVDERLSSPYTVELIDKFDSYYTGGRQNSLPVYRVMIDDADKHRLYINPTTASMRLYDHSNYVVSWVYPKFHTFRMGGILSNNELLRHTIIWILLIGGTILSITGVRLGIRYSVRIFKQRRAKRR